jgi:hypothetical protein
MAKLRHRSNKRGFDDVLVSLSPPLLAPKFMIRRI